MPFARNNVEIDKFNTNAILPFELRIQDFQMALQDVYDFFFDVNSHLSRKGLQRLDDMLRPAIMSGVLSDMLTASLAKHSRVLRENEYFNGTLTWSFTVFIRTTPSRQAAKVWNSRQQERPAVQSIRMEPEISGCVSLCTKWTRCPSPRATGSR
jgi:hypothetical protein